MNPWDNPLTRNRDFSGAFKSDKNAKLPDSTFSYEDYLKQQQQLQVPDTTINNIPVVNGVIDGDTLFGYRNDSWNNDQSTLTQKDIEYMQKCEEQTKKLYDELTDEQKKLLNDLESGQIMKPSKLKEDA